MAFSRLRSVVACLGIFAAAGLTALFAAVPPAISRVSVAAGGAQANAASGFERDSGRSGIALSGSGRFVAFESAATNLVSGDSKGRVDVFLKDLDTGTVERVSVSSSEAQANRDSYDPAISADGRFVAFVSEATNLAANDQNGQPDVFVRDREAGTTARVSLRGRQELPFPSLDPALSADGRFVAWHSRGPFVAGDTNKLSDVFLRDRTLGTVLRVSVTDTDVEASGGDSVHASLSGDGRFVAFHSDAHNLVAGDDNRWADVFRRDRGTSETVMVSVDPLGRPGDENSTFPSISSDGIYVAFDSRAHNLVPGESALRSHVFVRDLTKSSEVTLRLSQAEDGTEGAGNSGAPSISAEGVWIAFRSEAPNLVPGDTNGVSDIFVSNRHNGAIFRASASFLWDQAELPSYNPAISGDGRLAGFVSDAEKLVSGDTNIARDVFARNLDHGLSPPAPAGLTAVTASASRIDVSWRDTSTNEVRFELERDSGAGFTLFSTRPANQVSFSNSGLSPDSVYRYRVRAVNGLGASGYSNVAAAVTLPLLPAAPTRTTATAVSATDIRLDWLDASGNEEGFRLERRTGSGAFIALTTVPANNTRYTDRNLAQGVRYTYRLRSFNRAGTSAFDVEAGATTTLPAPSGLGATSPSSTQVTLTWRDNATGETGIRAERQNGTAWETLTTLAANAARFTDSGRTAETTPRYRVRALRGTVLSAPSKEAGVTLLAPPSTLAATAISSTEIALSWRDNSAAEDGTRIERRSGAGAFAQVAITGRNHTSYRDTGRTPSTTYVYRVRAFSAAAVSGYSGEVSRATPAARTPPNAPANLTGSFQSEDALPILLNWTHTGPVALFRIQRKVNDGSWSQIAALPFTARSFVDTNCGLNHVHRYRVRAVNSDGASPFSNEVVVEVVFPR